MNKETIQKIIKYIVYKCKTNYVWKTFTTSFGSFGATILFAIGHVFLGIFLKSVWHGSIGVYYILLVAIRGIILSAQVKSAGEVVSERKYTQYKAFMKSAMMLLLLNLALVVPIILMVNFEKPVYIGLIPALAIATYTTYKITMAIIHYRRQRERQKKKKHNNILVVQLRTINLIDALVSVLTLQNTLIMINGTENMSNIVVFSSAVIYTIIVLISLQSLMNGINIYRKEMNTSD